jgi:hypothetical protein
VKPKLPNSIVVLAASCFQNRKSGTTDEKQGGDHALASKEDYHFFVSAGKTIRTEPCVGAEGAHRLEALKALMSSSAAPEHRLALRWLRQQGLLDTFRLDAVRNAFAYLIKDNGEGSPQQAARAVAAIAYAVQPGMDFEMTLERAQQSLARNR